MNALGVRQRTRIIREHGALTKLRDFQLVISCIERGISLFNKQLLADIVEWDIYTWSNGIVFWNNTIDRIFDTANNKNNSANMEDIKVLDLGARDGGTSLYFALKGFKCVCSDLRGPSEKAKELHIKYGVSKLISYENVDCTCMDYEDESFDIVAFKSVMGAVGANNNDANIMKAINEMHRVLKPGGVLLFCENTHGSAFHMLMRKRFVKWSKFWNYVSLDFMNRAVEKFEERDIHSFGFLSCMVKNNSFVYWLDEKLCRIIKPHNQYMCYGYAKK
jgi:ubiquinone/menaquinone biosynthesis C-methylase UbiE